MLTLLLVFFIRFYRHFLCLSPATWLTSTWFGWLTLLVRLSEACDCIAHVAWAQAFCDPPVGGHFDLPSVLALLGVRVIIALVLDRLCLHAKRLQPGFRGPPTQNSHLARPCSCGGVGYHIFLCRLVRLRLWILFWPALADCASAWVFASAALWSLLLSSTSW